MKKPVYNVIMTSFASDHSSSSQILDIPVAGQPLCRHCDSAAALAQAAFQMTTNDFFLAGPENHIVETAVRWVLEGGSCGGISVPHYPIFFYGASGYGKTHLALGIFQSWRQTNRRNRGFYFTGDEFARSLAAALEAKTIDEFHNEIRKSEMLIIDDLDLLATKQAAQEELLVAIDSILDTRQTIVLTAQRFPVQLQFSNDRLIARLMAGLVVPIAPPALATRTVLLKRFAEQLGLHLTAPANQALAKELPVSVPQLFGTLAQLRGESDKKVINLAAARETIRNYATVTVPTIDRIAKTTAKQMGMKLADLKGKSRKSTTVRARNIAIYLSRQLTHASLKDIGKYFGGRDHTTVAHSTTEIESKTTSDLELRGLVLQIRESL